jgi:uncharacterized protein (DUF2236 family)
MSEPVMPPPNEWESLTPGKDTVTWRWAGDVRVLLAAGYALLLQVSHPTVGAGVSEHSQFRSDPWGRLFRTLDYSCTMVYAGPEAAAEMGARIRAFHRQIRGTLPDGSHYHALEPGAYAWVHATLAAGIVAAHERFGRALSDAQCEQLWSEWRALGRLLGIRDRDLPHDWRGFRAYFAEMVQHTLVHTTAVDEVLHALTSPVPPAMAAYYRPLWTITRVPAGHVVRLASIGLLPEVLRDRFGTPWSDTRALELRALARVLRAATPVMPEALLNTGPGYLAWREQALARGEVASAQLA